MSCDFLLCCRSRLVVHEVLQQKYLMPFQHVTETSIPALAIVIDSRIKTLITDNHASRRGSRVSWWSSACP